MPTSDIRLDLSWKDHPKREKLRRRVGAEGVLAWMDLWLWAAENKPSGILEDKDDEDVEIACGWRGQPGALVQAAIEVQLAERTEEGWLQLHNWHKRQPWLVSAEERSVAASKAARAKWGLPEEDAPPRGSGKTTRAERLRAARAIATHSGGEWELLLDICGRRCVRCGGDQAVRKDHIHPIYLGGSDGIDNLQPLCGSCNSSKVGDRTDYRPGGWKEELERRLRAPAQSQETPAARTRHSENASAMQALNGGSAGVNGASKLETPAELPPTPAETEKTPAPSPSPSPEEKKRVSRAHARGWSSQDFERLWVDLTAQPPGQPRHSLEATQLLADFAGRQEPPQEPEAFARAVLGAYAEVLEASRRRGKHHGVPTVAAFVTESRGTAVTGFQLALDWLAAKSRGGGRGGGGSPATPVARPADYSSAKDGEM